MMELVIISFLYCFDVVMNIISLGQWEKVRDEERAYKVKEQNWKGKNTMSTQIPSEIAQIIETKKLALSEERKQEEAADQREREELKMRGQIKFNEHLQECISKVPEWLRAYIDLTAHEPNYECIAKGWDHVENMDLFFDIPGLAQIAFDPQKDQWRAQSANWFPTWNSEPHLEFTNSSYWRSTIEVVLIEAQHALEEYQEYLAQYAEQKEERARQAEEYARKQQANEDYQRETEIRNELKQAKQMAEEQVLLDELRSDSVAMAMLKALVMIRQERATFEAQLEDANNSLYSMEEHWSRKARELRRQAEETQRHAEDEKYRLQDDLNDKEAKLKKAERGW